MEEPGALKFAFFMMPLHLPTEDPSLAFDRDLDLLQYAEQLGYDEFFVGEHHTAAWENIPAPDMFLAKASGMTSVIKLGTAVVSAPFHHPFELAERFAFLDHLSKGRVILGLGPCGLPPDARLFNIPPARLRPMLEESLDIIVRLLESPDPIDYEGKFWNLKGMALQLRSYQQPRLKLAMATTGNPHSLDLAGKYGMMIFSPSAQAPPPALPFREHYPRLKATAEKYGYHMEREDTRIATFVYLADTREQAWADVKESITRDVHDYFFVINTRGGWELSPEQPDDEITPEFVAKRRRWIIGTPDDAIEQLEAIDKEAGGLGGVMITTHEWVPHAKSRYSMELFARYVMPHFRGHTADLKREWKRTQDARKAGQIPVVLGRDLKDEFPSGGNQTNLHTNI
jgi:limonene 1,2-monooxygenase